MLTKPHIIGIASIIPGLGFLLLKQPLRAGKAFVSVFIAVVVSYLIYSSIPIPWVKEYCWYIPVIAWFVQGVSAVNFAWLLSRQDIGDSHVANETNQKILSRSILGINRETRFQQIANQHLKDGEVLITLVTANRTVTEEHSWGTVTNPFQACYLVLTNKALLVMEIDFEYIPVNIERINLNKIKDVDYRKGIIRDNLVFMLPDKKELDFSVHLKYRKQVQDIVNRISQRQVVAAG